MSWLVEAVVEGVAAELPEAVAVVGVAAIPVQPRRRVALRPSAGLRCNRLVPVLPDPPYSRA